jgi:SAM-dependent methyltransferase
VAELRIPALNFQAYLEAKAPIDAASLDPGLSGRFRESLDADRAPRLLDLGTGTGATLRRVLSFAAAGGLELTGLDSDARSLELAGRRIAELLRAQGWRVRERAQEDGWRIGAGRAGRRVRVRLLHGDLLDPGLPALLGRAGFGYLTAHAFLDLLPLARALRVMRALLAPGGLLYPTLNYDGSTVLLPEDQDPGFERALLRAYDRSMERRCVEGEPSGGAFSGRRLRAELERGGFRLIGEGRSDWNVPPSPGPHDAGTAGFLGALLGMIAGEGLRAPGLDSGALQAWYGRRTADLASGRLGLAARNLDLLAVRD